MYICIPTDVYVKIYGYVNCRYAYIQIKQFNGVKAFYTYYNMADGI